MIRIYYVCVRTMYMDVWILYVLTVYVCMYTVFEYINILLCSVAVSGGVEKAVL